MVKPLSDSLHRVKWAGAGLKAGVLSVKDVAGDFGLTDILEAGLPLDAEFDIPESVGMRMDDFERSLTKSGTKSGSVLESHKDFVDKITQSLMDLIARRSGVHLIAALTVDVEYDKDSFSTVVSVQTRVSSPEPYTESYADAPFVGVMMQVSDLVAQEQPLDTILGEVAGSLYRGLCRKCDLFYNGEPEE